MSTARSLPISVEEYLKAEEAAASKSEFVNGEVFAMAGVTPRHADIVSNIAYALRVSMGEASRCRVTTSDLRLWVEPANLFTYPDVMLTCDERKLFESAGSVSITNPVIIAEVLSKSTRNYDKGDKFTYYRSIPSLVDYLTVEQDFVGVEWHHRSAGKWSLEEFTSLDNVISLEGCRLKLADIYRGIGFTRSQ